VENANSLIPFLPDQNQLAKGLSDSNTLAARYGLILVAGDIKTLLHRQQDVLRETNRIEFGSGPYEKLIYALCDSPYIDQSTYADTLGELCELFYRFKSESGEIWSDDELIEKMADLFNGACYGAVELVSDRLWQSLHTEPETIDDEDEEDDEPLE
jgi:hypothetical protein